MRYRVAAKAGIVAIFAALVAAACGGSSTPTTPTTPSTVQVTEAFSGALNVNGAAAFPFTSSAAGSITATLTSLGPDSTLAIGLSLGTWNGTSCSQVLSNDSAFQGQALLGTATSSGSLCVRLYDVGKLTDAIAYTVTVVHP
jgi:predicted flavoprotein YhiN